jgi:ATP-dependent DNA helicase RecQ
LPTRTKPRAFENEKAKLSDATLVEMAARRPSTHAELLTISGVGSTKLERYGDVFLATIARTEG